MATEALSLGQIFHGGMPPGTLECRVRIHVHQSLLNTPPSPPPLLQSWNLPLALVTRAQRPMNDGSLIPPFEVNFTIEKEHYFCDFFRRSSD